QETAAEKKTGFLDMGVTLTEQSGQDYNDSSNPLNSGNYRKYAAGKTYYINRMPYTYRLDGMPDPVFGHGFISTSFRKWYEMCKQLELNAGLHLDISYTIWGQWASKRVSGVSGKATPPGLTTGRLDVQGYWDLPQNNPLGNSRVNFRMRQTTNYGWSDGTTLDTTIGDVSGVNGGYDPSIAMMVLSYGQELFDGAVDVEVGKVHPGMYFFASPVADDETSQFINNVLDGSPCQVINNYAPGAIIRINELFGRKDMYLYAAAIDMADTSTTCAGGIGRGKWGVVTEYGWTPKFEDLQGHYRFDWWYADNTHFGFNSGQGAGLNFDQEIAHNCILFLTYAYNANDSYSQEHQLGYGVGILEPFKRRGEMFGVGGGWAKATENGADEQLLETFYRFQLTDSIQFSPDLQMIFNPAYAPDTSVCFVLGFRVKVQF
ncbi:MAG TPA: carbohydrate porin, partial [Phycisphaerae bacterium]|nr:carbohydrate porin [Phycisphaerae bacterium]